MTNENKTFHCTESSITVYYTDSKKHFVHPYESPMEELQIYGNSYKGVQYQDLSQSKVFDADEFSPYQTMLYKQVLLGLKYFSDEQVRSMSFKKKLAIDKRHKRAQKVLNEWKQLIINKEVDDFLLSWFPHSKFVKNMVNNTHNYTHESVTNYQSFAELNISKKDIADKLIKVGLLPKQFFILKKII